MKNIWNKLRNKWLDYWEDDEFNMIKWHLSQHDKRSLLYGGFIISILTLTVCLFATGINNIRISHKNNEDVLEIYNMIYSYLATATEDEYDKIAQSIRHDLVISQYRGDMKEFLSYIPNTADSCCLERSDYLDRICLVFLNTGETYGLDIYNKADSIAEQKEIGMMLISGYDEINEAQLIIRAQPSQGTSSVSLDRGRGIVSFHKMKSLYCDDCIQDILNTVENELVDEAVLYDTEKKKFYPVTEGSLQIGDYAFDLFYEAGSFRIDIDYIGV